MVKKNAKELELEKQGYCCDNKCNKRFSLWKFILGLLFILFVFIIGIIVCGYVLVKFDKSDLDDKICVNKDNKITCSDEIIIKDFFATNIFSLKDELDLLYIEEDSKTEVEVLFDLGNVFEEKELKLGYKSIVDELDGMRRISVYLNEEEYSFSLRYDRIQDLNIALFGDYIALSLVSDSFIHDSFLALLDEDGNEIKRFENVVSNYVVDEIVSEDGVMSFNSDYCPLTINEDYIRYCYVKDDTFPFSRLKKEITLVKYSIMGEEQTIKTFDGYFSQEY